MYLTQYINTLNLKYKVSVDHNFIKPDIVDIKIIYCETAGLPSESPAQFPPPPATDSSRTSRIPWYPPI